MAVKSAVNNSKKRGPRAALREGPIRQSRGPRGWWNPRRQFVAGCSTARQRAPCSLPQTANWLPAARALVMLLNKLIFMAFLSIKRVEFWR